MSALTGEFVNTRQEAAFRAELWPVWHRRIRVVVLAAVAAYLITSLTDYLLIGTGFLFSLIIAARLLVAAYGLGFVAVAERRRSVLLSDLGLLLFLVLLITTFLGMVSVRPEGLRFSAPAAVLILCVFYAVPMTRMWITLTSALYLSIGLVVAARFFEQSPLRDIGVIGVQMAVVNLIGFLIARRLHQDARTAWVNQGMLERRERHQRLLAQLSSQFLGVRNDQVDTAIQQAFKSLCDHTDADRAYLMEFNAGHETGSMTHEWCAEGISATRATMQNIPSALMPWASLKMQRGEIVQADRVNDLPPEAAAERDLNRAQGVQSFLCVPLTHDGLLHGMIGLDCVHRQRRWDAETIELLRFAGQAIFNVLQRARAVDLLEEQESKYETLTMLSPTGIFSTDAEGYCQYFNAYWTQLTGLPVETALGNRWQQSVHPDDLARVRGIWEDAIRRKLPADAEYRYRRADGSIVWAHARCFPHLGRDGNLLGFIGTVHDVTERREAHAVLEQRAVLDRLAARLALQFVHASGDDVETTINHVLAELGAFAGADRCYLFRLDWQSRRTSCTHEWCGSGIPSESGNLKDLSLDDFSWSSEKLLRGETVVVPRVSELPPEAANERAEFERQRIQSLILVPVVSSGRIAGFIGLDAVRQQVDWSHDIVLLLRMAGEIIVHALDQQGVQQDQLRRADELAELNLRLEQRNEEMHRFAYVASHDLQEPLRAVSGFASLLAEKYRGRLDAEADEYVSHLTAAAGRLHRLINDLLVYTRIDHQVSAPVACDLNEITRLAISNLDETVQSLRAKIDVSSLPTVSAQPLPMIHLLQHLLANALRFHGSVAPHIKVSARRVERDWVISVADNGIGIAPTHATRVFEIFHRLHPTDRYPGNGIGLPVCKRIVERHGGRIWVEPNEPCGSVFHFTLPAALSAPAAQAEASRHVA